MKNIVEIVNIIARQILDSRCFPTVEVEVILEVKEKSDCCTKNFIYNNIVLFILNATAPFLY